MATLCHREAYDCLKWDTPHILCTSFQTSLEWACPGFEESSCPSVFKPCNRTSKGLKGLVSSCSILIQLSSVSVPFQCILNLDISNARLYSLTLGRPKPPMCLGGHIFFMLILGLFPSQRKSLIVLSNCLNNCGNILTGNIKET